MWQSIREFILRAAGIFTTRRREREIAEELEFHLALKEASRGQNGVAPSDAAHQARRDFGGLERWKERCRDASTIRVVEDLQRDLWLAFRMLRKSPTFTYIAIATRKYNDIQLTKRSASQIGRRSSRGSSDFASRPAWRLRIWLQLPLVQAY